jgi:hypothetical protein
MQDVEAQERQPPPDELQELTTSKNHDVPTFRIASDKANANKFPILAGSDLPIIGVNPPRPHLAGKTARDPKLPMTSWDANEPAVRHTVRILP